MSGGHGLRFVAERHGLVLAGETRLYFDVGPPGVGDVRGVAPRVERTACQRCWVRCLSGLGPSSFALGFSGLCLFGLFFVTYLGFGLVLIKFP